MRVSKKFIDAIKKKETKIIKKVGAAPSRVALTDVLGDILNNSDMFEEVEIKPKEKKKGKKCRSKEFIFRFDIM